MRVKDVPQDHDPSYEGLKKLCYALNDKGEFVPTSTDGWHVEETVKTLAWQTIEKDLKETRQKIRQGEMSALAFFMKFRQMDPLLLAQNMGTFTWRVKWHLRPNVFKKLSPQWIDRYAKCLEVSPEILKNYRGEDGISF